MFYRQIKKRIFPVGLITSALIASCFLTPHMPTKAPAPPENLSLIGSCEDQLGAQQSLSASELEKTAISTEKSTEQLTTRQTPKPTKPSLPITPTAFSNGSPSPTLTITATEEISLAVIPSFGIDYRRPNLFLDPGEQSLIPDLTVLPSVRDEQTPLEVLGMIYSWLGEDFSSYSAGGATIGKITVEELLEQRSLGGCHDYGLVFSAAARAYGYPAVMVETYRISWMKAYQDGTSEGYQGHIFVEVYTGDHWVLVNPTSGWFVGEGYDPGQQVIPIPGTTSVPSGERDGYFVDCKGVDSWAMGITSVEELNQRMEAAADSFLPKEISFPAYTFQQLN